LQSDDNCNIEKAITVPTSSNYMNVGFYLNSFELIKFIDSIMEFTKT